jgi:ankyrin repeat protein
MVRTGEYFEAIRAGEVIGLERMLAHEPRLLQARTSSPHAPGAQDRCTGLHAAVYADQPEAVRLLLDAGIDVEARTAEGRTALHDAIEFGAGAIRDFLLQRGAEVDICAAAILGRMDRLRELLDATPELANDRSTHLTPLGWAAFGNQVEAAAELLVRGALMDDGELLCAASVGHVEVGRLLMDHGAAPDELFTESGVNALHVATLMRYTDDSRRFIEMLLDAGVDINRRTAQGKTALQLAEQDADSQGREQASGSGRRDRCYAEVAELLRRRGGGQAPADT